MYYVLNKMQKNADDPYFSFHFHHYLSATCFCNFNYFVHSKIAVSACSATHTVRLIRHTYVHAGCVNIGVNSLYRREESWIIKCRRMFFKERYKLSFLGTDLTSLGTDLKCISRAQSKHIMQKEWILSEPCCHHSYIFNHRQLCEKWILWTSCEYSKLSDERPNSRYSLHSPYSVKYRVPLPQSSLPIFWLFLSPCMRFHLYSQSIFYQKVWKHLPWCSVGAAEPISQLRHL